MAEIKATAAPTTEMDALLLGRIDANQWVLILALVRVLVLAMVMVILLQCTRWPAEGKGQNHGAKSQELTVTGDNSRRNYRGIFLSILVLTLISSIIVASIFLVNPDILKFSKLFQIREKIFLEEAIFGSLAHKQRNVHWLERTKSWPGGHQETLFFVDLDREIKLVSIDTNDTTNTTNSDPILPPVKLNFSTLVSKSSLAAKCPTLKLIHFVNTISSTYLTITLEQLMYQEYGDYKLSPSRRYILANSDKSKVYRHTYIGKVHIYDIEQDKFVPLEFSIDPSLSSSSLDTGPLDSPEAFDASPAYDQTTNKFQYVAWVKRPNEPNGDALILVHNNDIYYKSSIKAKEVRLTNSGQPGVIYNGIPDWLYEEEILFEDNAIEVSPSASRLAYMKFNDSGIDIMRIPYYGSVDEPLPKLLSIRYPKAGRVNPTVEVYVVDLTRGSPTPMILSLPNDLNNQQHYLGSMSWLSDDKLSLTWLNRHQNISYLLVCQQTDPASDSGASWGCIKNLLIESQSGWLDMLDKVLPFNDHYYFALLPKYESAQLGFFKHIAKISLLTGQYTFITSGSREVTEMLGIDRLKQIVYYVSTQENRPDVRHLYWANIVADSSSNGVAGNNTAHNCLTCNLYQDDCQFNSIKLSPTTTYYLHGCLGPGVPKLQLRSTDEVQLDEPWPQLLDPLVSAVNLPPTDNASKIGPALAGHQQQEPQQTRDKTLVWSIEENIELREKLKIKAMAQVKRLFVPIGNNGQYNASVLMLLPPKFKDDEDQNVQYPMVVSVYAGPGSQRVDQRFDINYGHYLASNKKIIYTMIDGRGSGYQGSNLLYEVYHRLGSVEIEDQISVTKHLVSVFPFIDRRKVAIWGWSYGGYAAAMALAQGSVSHEGMRGGSRSDFSLPHWHPEEVFECAVSVAPVTHWLYYDTAYTERYMSSPYKNEQYDRQIPGDHLLVTRDQSNGSPRNDPPNLVRLLVTGPTREVPHASHTGQSKQGDHKDESSTATFSVATSPITTNHNNSNNNNHNYNKVSFLSSDLNNRYRKASLLDSVSHIDRKRFLLIHGTADDNVHFQQSIMLMKLLTSLNILFETQLYPDENHAINHYAANLHLFSTMNDFFGECFEIALSQDSLSHSMVSHKHRDK